MSRAWMLGLLMMVGGCVLEDDVLRQSELYACASDQDCPEAGFVCRLEVGLCALEVSMDASFCADADDDGYGVGPERRGCVHAQEDLDDGDASVYPGAPDLCDGKDNDEDGSTDVISCTGSCPQTGVGPENSIGFCEAGVCVYRPANQTPPGCARALTCNGVSGWEEVPDACMF